MADHVLYFPSIRVPSGEWFSRILLYWESVSTIVPLEVLEQPDILGINTRELMREGLVQVRAPDQEKIWSAGNYYGAFLELVDRTRDPSDCRPFEERPSVHVHLDKTGSGLAYALVDRKLACFESGPEHAGWFRVERETADLLMAFLATVLAQAAGSTVPISDSADALAAYKHVRQGSERSPSDVIVDNEAVRTCMLEGVLPAPSAIRAAEIATFKGMYGKQLVRMRNRVEQEVMKVANLHDSAEREYQLKLSAQSLKQESEEVEARMKESGWASVTPGIMIGVVGTALALADATITQGKLTMASGIAGLLGATWGAFDGSKPKKELLDRPMAYAAIAQRKLA